MDTAQRNNITQLRSRRGVYERLFLRSNILIIMRSICETSVTYEAHTNDVIGIKYQFPMIFIKAVTALMNMIFFCSHRAISRNEKSEEIK